MRHLGHGNVYLEQPFGGIIYAAYISPTESMTQWFFVYSQSCISATTIKLKTSRHSMKKAGPHSSLVSLPSLP